MTSRTKGWIVALLALAGLVGFVFQLPTPEEPAAPLPNGSFVIRDVRLFDGERVVERTNVRVEGGKIVDVGTGAVDPSVPVVDGTGRTLLPGLIDAHTHSWGDALERAVVFGVITQLDHEANRGPWLHLEERGFRVREIALRRDGTLWLRTTLIHPQTSLDDLRELLATIREFARGGPAA